MTNPLHKYEQILSTFSLIRHKSYDSQENRTLEIKLLLTKIEELRFELAHNKAIESITGHIDRTLAHMAFSIASLIYEGRELIKYIEGVLYYERDEMIATKFKDLLAQNYQAGDAESVTALYNELRRERKYLRMFEMLNQATQHCLSGSSNNPKDVQNLVMLNVDLLELLGASKQYEMEFSMHSQLIRNRNALFRTLLRDNPTVLTLFDKIIKGPK